MHAGLEVALSWHFRYFTWAKLVADKPIRDYPLVIYDYLTATRILYDVGQITRIEYDALMALNKARNTIAHYIFKQESIMGHPIKIKLIVQALKGADKTFRNLADRLFVDILEIGVPEELKKKGRPYVRLPVKTNWRIPKSH